MDTSLEQGICKCGCGGKTNKYKSGFRKWIFGHQSRGKNNPLFGKGMPIETRKKISETKKKRYHTYKKPKWERSKEFRERMRQITKQRQLPFVDRFWNKVKVFDEDKCWLWIGAKKNTGYGVMHRNVNGKKKEFGAHRMSYELAFGLIPDGFLVRHTCDNRICVNPAHLILGQMRDNIQDMVDRQRRMGAGASAECPTCGTIVTLSQQKMKLPG